MKHFNSIVITGASSGIGEALALDYAAPGVALALSGRDAARLEAVAAACSAKGATVDADRKSTRLNSSHVSESRMPSSA